MPFCHTIRASIILRSAAESLLEHKDSTISLWINNFAAMGFDALHDQKRESPPNATFTETDKKNS